ncbi:MAG: hypothetical protein J6S67_23265 [Methanobrevibacter sp.]|nr:hypothetical protein [Methanobrevibacter sp.]
MFATIDEALKSASEMQKKNKQGKKIKYHLNGTNLNFDTRKALAKWIGCAASTIIYAEQRDCKLKSFYVKGWRIKRIKGE